MSRANAETMLNKIVQSMDEEMKNNPAATEAERKSNESIRDIGLLVGLLAIDFVYGRGNGTQG